MLLDKKQQHQLPSITQRIRFQRQHPVWRSQYKAFINSITKLNLPPNATALSASCGNGMWDFLAFSNNPRLKTIIASDVVDCPVKTDDIQLLTQKNRHWSFQKTAKDEPLPFQNDYFDLVFHQDVLEHTTKPYLFLSENYRILKPGGYLLFGTPNLFRSANICKLLFGRLSFPHTLGATKGLGAIVHQQEFHEYQLRNMLIESGFHLFAIQYCFSGVSFLNIYFNDFPTSKLGRNTCQYLFLVAQTPQDNKK